MTRVLVIGHSHIVALQEAHADDEDGLRVRRPDLEFDFIRLLRIVPGEEFPRLDIDEQTLSEIAARPYDLIVAAMGGNGHNVFGLASHPVPFDFVLPEFPELPLEPAADHLPVALVRSCVRRPSENAFTALKVLRAGVSAPVVQIESPPPIPSEDYIRAHPGNYRGPIERTGVSPAVLRYKLWRLNSSLFQGFCSQAGIEFLPAPIESQDPQGMLVEIAWNEDPAHGNSWYGARVLRQLAMRFPAPN
ncbi:MAG: hypothetical protein V4787_00155 [Pseudomonadota bacterium]